MTRKFFVPISLFVVVIFVISLSWYFYQSSFFVAEQDAVLLLSDQSGDSSNVVVDTPDEDVVVTDMPDDNVPDNAPVVENVEKYFFHRDITATIFWVGESAGEDNDNITNVSSAWDDKWTKHFGGVDDPDHRKGYFPAKFVPRENPFYFALPYNDFNNDGERRSNAFSVVPWAHERKWSADESLVKNRWVSIVHNGKTVYAQWEDSGPFVYNDVEYVFGGVRPQNAKNQQAGIDVSPAVATYLNLSGMDLVDWQFVDDVDVPSGPWKEIVTTSQIHWD
ncbi:MAG: hypothetical protein KC736_03680 [Candidatus Moranbacteria bacterium]|nr:hypothetical protein [Candidatus Moranbacteria bacterium]